MLRRSFRLFLIALTLVWSVRISSAASVDDSYYKGKTVRLIVAFSAGGGYDTYTRTIARHLGKHVPGNPAFVVENMTGAGDVMIPLTSASKNDFASASSCARPPM